MSKNVSDSDQINNCNKFSDNKIYELQELYSLIEKGLEDELQGKIRPFSDAISNIRRELNL